MASTATYSRTRRAGAYRRERDADYHRRAAVNWFWIWLWTHGIGCFFGAAWLMGAVYAYQSETVAGIISSVVWLYALSLWVWPILAVVGFVALIMLLWHCAAK